MVGQLEDQARIHLGRLVRLVPAVSQRRISIVYPLCRGLRRVPGYIRISYRLLLRAVHRRYRQYRAIRDMWNHAQLLCQRPRIIIIHLRRLRVLRMALARTIRIAYRNTLTQCRIILTKLRQTEAAEPIIICLRIKYSTVGKGQLNYGG